MDENVWDQDDSWTGYIHCLPLYNILNGVLKNLLECQTFHLINFVPATTIMDGKAKLPYGSKCHLSNNFLDYILLSVLQNHHCLLTWGMHSLCLEFQISILQCYLLYTSWHAISVCGYKTMTLCVHVSFTWEKLCAFFTGGNLTEAEKAEYGVNSKHKLCITLCWSPSLHKIGY